MRKREIETAKHFGILKRMEDLERELLKIEGVGEKVFKNHLFNDYICFDLSGFWDNLHEVILIPRYYIPVSAPDYYEQRRAQLQKILDVCERFDLHETGDRIEDYGEHWYIVRHCGESWRNLIKEET